MVGIIIAKKRVDSQGHARKKLSVWCKISYLLLTVIAVMLVVLLGRTFVFNVYVIPSMAWKTRCRRRPRICLAIDSETLCTAPWRHHRVQRSRRLDGGGAASHQSDVDNRQQSLPNQTCHHQSAGDTVTCKGIRGAHHGQRQTIDESAYLKSARIKRPVLFP